MTKYGVMNSVAEYCPKCLAIDWHYLVLLDYWNSTIEVNKSNTQDGNVMFPVELPPLGFVLSYNTWLDSLYINI